MESTNGHELLNIYGISNNDSGTKVRGFHSISKGSTFLVPSKAKGEFSLLLLLDISSLHQKYVNTCTLNGDGDSFGVTGHKGEERLVLTAKKTSAGSRTSPIQNFENESMLDAGSIQNWENEPMLEERSVSEVVNTNTSLFQLLKRLV